MRTIAKLIFGIFITTVIAFILKVGLGYIRSEWTSVSMDQVRSNVGDQVGIRANMGVWGLIWWGVLIVGILIIAGLWYALFKKELKKLPAMFMFVIIIPILLAGCTTSNFVIITPPNYAIVVNLSDTGEQATGNNFGEGELLNVTQIQVSMRKCAINSQDRCPDKLVAEVQGSPESRIYSSESNSGTSASNQALCFEATGANGCLDFSVTAIIRKEDAKCYANKMGVSPAMEGEVPSRFHFIATPLAEALDTRVIQIASSQFAQRVAPLSPLNLALSKFDIFEEIKPAVIQAVHDQTCISITNLAISNGIVWSNQSIQDQINQATIITNQLELVAQQNELLAVQNTAFIERALEIEEQFGLEAAIEFMRIQKWDGSLLLPFMNTTVNEP